VPYRFTFKRYAVPFNTPIRTAHELWSSREGVIVQLESTEGDLGWGEAAPIPAFGTETVDELAEACARVNGEWHEDVAALIPSTLHCLQFALYAALRGVRAAAASRTGETVATTAAQEYLPVAALLPAGRVCLEKIAPLGDSGFRTFKWKVGVGDIADELAILDDLISKLPSGSKLRLDANGAWDRRKAERWLERCADRPIEFLEQPIAPSMRGADDMLLGLAGDYPTPLGLDESIATGAEIGRWLDLGWPGVFVIKPSLLGHPDAALARLERAKGKVVFSSALETGIGAQSALRVAMSWTLERRAIGFGVYPLFADRQFDGPSAAPFIRAQDIEALKPEDLWTALT
jgi:o-succinylbenzoate synthase